MLPPYDTFKIKGFFLVIDRHGVKARGPAQAKSTTSELRNSGQHRENITTRDQHGQNPLFWIYQLHFWYSRYSGSLTDEIASCSSDVT